MNKVFRVVWSQATQSWVAVSELTKAHKKQSSSNSLKAALGAAAMLLSINTAEANIVIGNVDNNTIAVGEARAGSASVAIGWGSKADAVNSVAIGEHAELSGSHSNTVVGTYAYSLGDRNTVIGNNAQAGRPEGFYP